MSKLAIFGDSFATDFRMSFNLIDLFYSGSKQDRNSTKNPVRASLVDADPAWWEIFKKDNYFSEVQIYGYGGADNYFSYLNFLTEHHNYDTVVFIITNFERMSIKIDKDDKKIGPRREDAWCHVSGYETCNPSLNTIEQLPDDLFEKNINYNYESNAENLINHKIGYSLSREELVNVVNTANMYQRDIVGMDYIRNYIFNILMLQNMINLRPDIKFIAAFEYGYHLNDDLHKFMNIEVKNTNTTLRQIWYLEDTIMGLDDNDRQFYQLIVGHPSHTFNDVVEKIEKEYNREMRFDMRVAHMTSISHFLLYEQLKKFLKTDKNFFEINMVPFIHELKKIKFNDWFITLKEFTSWIEKKGLDPFGINA